MSQIFIEMIDDILIYHPSKETYFDQVLPINSKPLSLQRSSTLVPDWLGGLLCWILANDSQLMMNGIHAQVKSSSL